MPLAGRRSRRPWPVRAARRLVAILGPDASVAGQSLVALVLNSSTSLVAGAVLGSITDTFERLPGLLILVPAAIGLRGNVFSALGSRLSTAIHTGTFRLTLRPGTVVGDNVAASLVLTTGVSLALAVLAKAVAIGFGVPHTIPLVDLAAISVAAGVLASLVVLAATMMLAAGATRYGWDLDNLVAPIVATLGDVLTLPALWLATGLVGHGHLTAAAGATLVTAGVAFTVYGWRSARTVLRGIVRESWPVLTIAAALSTLAGVVLEKQLETFSDLPALLVLVPAFVSSAGALGGILSSRLATALHLGLVPAGTTPPPAVRRDAGLLGFLAAPVYVFNALGALAVGAAVGVAGPSAPSMLAVTLLGAAGALAFVAAVAYYGSVASYRAGVDPDTYGIPLVTSSVDFVGVVSLILAAHLLGVA